MINRIYLGLDPDSLVTTARTEITATFSGFEGDRHAGLTRKSDSRTPNYPRGTEIRNDRQLSIVSVEDLQTAAAALNLPFLKPEWLGANILVEGIPRLSKLPPNTRLYLSGGVSLVVTAENNPCTLAGRAIAEGARQLVQGGEHLTVAIDSLTEMFPKAAKGLRGVVACVELPGVVRPGEMVIAHIPMVEAYPLE